MPREKVLEAQVGHEMPRRRCKPAVILLTVARQNERLRLVLPLQALDIEAPQVPFGAGDIRRVCVQVLHRERRNLRRSHSATGISVASTACTINSLKLFCVAERGAVVRNRANSAIIVSSEKSRVHTRRYAWLAMVVETFGIIPGRQGSGELAAGGC